MSVRARMEAGRRHGLTKTDPMQVYASSQIEPELTFEGVKGDAFRGVGY